MTLHLTDEQLREVKEIATPLTPFERGQWHWALVAIKQHSHFVITYARALNRFHCVTPLSSTLG